MMSTISIDGLMEGFSSLLHNANPAAIPEFMSWIDSKVSSYKTMKHKYELASIIQAQSQPKQDRYFQLANALNSNLISDLHNQNKETSQTSNSLNLNALSNSALAALLGAKDYNPSSSATLKVPCISPSQKEIPPIGIYSPQKRIEFSQHHEYSSLRNLLQSSSRVDLKHEFDDSTNSDIESIRSNEEDDLKHQFNKQSTCKVCGKMFLHRSSYRRHMKLHQGVFTHHCGKCHRRFTRKEHFTRHKCHRKSLTREKSDLDSSFDSINDSPVKSARDWYKADFSLPDVVRPLNMTSQKILEHSSDDNMETSSVSSGQVSPPQGSDICKRNGRKSSAPRKVDTKLYPEHEDYMSDIDESMYEQVRTPKMDEDNNCVLDMSMRKETRCEDSGEKKEKHHGASVDHLSKLDAQYSKCFHGRNMSNEQVTTVNNNGISAVVSPSPGFKIGDLIENAVTKYHSSTFERAELNIPQVAKASSAHPTHVAYPSSPKMKAKMYSKLQSAAEVKGEKTAKSPSVAKGTSTTGQEEILPGNFLATDTGTYQITTEHLEGETVPDENSSGKVIKVVKQGNYLKLKKEAQVIDGELRFICPHCNKVFHRSSNFSRHMRIHRGVYSYICSTCQRGFYRKEHFDKHKCYRKSMATTWERKTKVDLDRDQDRDIDRDTPPEKCNKENQYEGKGEQLLDKESMKTKGGENKFMGEDALATRAAFMSDDIAGDNATRVSSLVCDSRVSILESEKMKYADEAGCFGEEMCA